jgi:hypothetical protein
MNPTDLAAHRRLRHPTWQSILLVFDHSCAGAVVRPAPSDVLTVAAQVHGRDGLVAGMYLSKRSRTVRFHVRPASGPSFIATIRFRTPRCRGRIKVIRRGNPGEIRLLPPKPGCDRR